MDDMALLADDLLRANATHAARHTAIDSPRPKKHLAIVTCMDTRLDVLSTFGLELGEAIIIRNAGARVTEDVLRSLALAVHELGVHSVVVMQHTTCGLVGLSDEELRQRTGADIDFLAIEDHDDELRNDIDLLTSQSYLASVSQIVGLLYDTAAGTADVRVRWQRPDA